MVMAVYFWGAWVCSFAKNIHLTDPKTCITFDRKFDVISVRVENINASLYPGWTSELL